MSWISRIANVFRSDRLNPEIDEELESHVAEAVEQGRDPVEARRAFGSALRLREESRDFKLVPWLDSLRADAVFGWRQLAKNKIASAAAVLSLALAIGACTAAFRLIDALLLRPLPVTAPERLYALFRHGIDPDGKPRSSESYEYPLFRRMRAAVKGQAELIAVGYAERVDITFGSEQEVEKAYRQYVSGWMFNSLGLRPALGRLLSASDDVTPGAHPYAVLSYDYWKRRFGRDPGIIGRTFRMGNDLSPYQIIGVAEERFTGTETGIVTDVFLPTMMNTFSVNRAESSWIRIFVCLNRGVSAAGVRERLRPIFRVWQEERVVNFARRPKEFVTRFLSETLWLESAAAGLSDLQKDYRSALVAGGVLVALVMLIACANVANLMIAQAAARIREMALRVSIGAGRYRLVQLMLVESAMLGLLAAAIGGLFAWWSAPLIAARINPPDDAARLVLPADWRVLGFGLALTVAVTLLFGLAPSLRASAIQPVSALKGGEDPHSRRRTMHALIAVQVAFCFLVLFVAGLFVATFNRMATQPTGFSAERLLAVDTIAVRPEPPVFWDQVRGHLGETPGVEAVALSGWPLLNRNMWNAFITIDARSPAIDQTYLMNVSPGWLDLMKIPFLEGRDFRPEEAYPGVAIVNETFARRYFDGESPVGKWFDRTGPLACRIVGVVRDARYFDMREPIKPVAYVPFASALTNGGLRPVSRATFIVRTSSSNPLALASTLRREVPRARSEFRVSNIRTQAELVLQHTIRERLLAALAAFFAAVALLLAGIGLYGVLDYSVLQRRREIGIRMAIGAQAGDIARRVTADVFRMVLAGALAGLALGVASVRYIESLLYQVKLGDPAMLALPSIAILAAALLAAAPAVIRAVRIDPVSMLRAD